MTSSGKFTEIRRALPFEEFAGTLKELFELDGALIARIGKINIDLPHELEPSFRPLIGQRITILRNDIPDKPYLFRVLAEEPNHVERGEYGG
jgi:hypothetical protein